MTELDDPTNPFSYRPSYPQASGRPMRSGMEDSRNDNNSRSSVGSGASVVDLGSISDFSNLENSLRETMRSSASDNEKRQKALDIQRQAWDQTRQVLAVPKDLSNMGEQPRDEQLNQTVKKLESKEQEILRKKLAVEQRVRAQVSRVEQEARRLDELRRELNALEDPTRKEVSELRKRIELVDRDLRPIKALCDRKEKELKEAVVTYNDKSAQKTELVGKLFEIVTESERVRIAKLEELNNLLSAMEDKSNGH
eukprot:TRINITY_DN6681_c0_g1_i1.p1 TRINITY_DN6681_c0_g1~~TRINITY_DN6681_c0_g1_i1.p1  ORF type:complete len:253 (+),score=45.92 TRINITY_DN6681_c0_g1_i1:335-1093(+)